jgi:hypothetical protein
MHKRSHSKSLLLDIEGKDVNASSGRIVFFVGDFALFRRGIAGLDDFETCFPRKHHETRSRGEKFQQ